jgi:hypothetical protein
VAILDESPAPVEQAEDAPQPDPTADSSLEDLRHILLRHQAEKVERLEADLDRLEHQIYDEGALVRMIAPVLGEAIRLKIREARDEMIEALYPIIGKVVQRAVTEAVADLARSLDAQVKSSFDFRLTWWRLKARMSGASEAQIRLRELLPFTVTDVLLIHRETGLLLVHIPGESSKTSDTDLFSGMLTAIRDFARDTLGDGGQTGLGEIIHGDQSILIETAQHTYLAVIINGTARPQFRAEMRERLIEVEHSHAEELREYQGNAARLTSVKHSLSSLIATGAPRRLSVSQKRFLAGTLAGLIILLTGCGVFTGWIWRIAHQTPAPLVLVITPAAATPTVTPSATASPTWTPTALPTPSQTLTPRPTPPVLGVILGDVWLHAGPSAESPRSGEVLTTGEQVELLALDSEWAQVRRITEGQDKISGWIPARWLGVTASIPAEIITPGALP